MKPFLVDVPVLILFFNRPQQLSQVFEQVRNARPSKLFLYQDGPRGEHDLPGIKACREVTDQIDWDCKVHRMYQEKNYGCDPSEYISQKWAFSMVGNGNIDEARLLLNEADGYARRAHQDRKSVV